MKRLIYTIILISVAFAYSYQAANADISKISNEEYSQGIIKSVQSIRSGVNSDGSPTSGRDLTHILWDIEVNKDKLTPEAKAFLKKENLLEAGKPSYHDMWQREGGFFRYFFSYSGEDAIPEDDTNQNGIPDILEMYDQYFELMRQKYIAHGFPMPVFENSENIYEIYLSNTATGKGVYGYCSPQKNVGDNPYTPQIEKNSYTSYIAIRTNFQGFGTPHETAVKITSAHEFQHAIQMGIELNKMTIFSKEACAVWSEEWVYEYEYDGFQYLSSFFSNPDMKLTYQPSGQTDAHYSRPYASWIYIKQLTDLYGEEIVKDIYFAHINNEQEQAFDEALQAHGTDFISSIKNFFTTMVIFAGNPDYKPHYFSIGDTLSKRFPNAPKIEKTSSITESVLNFNSKEEGNKKLEPLSADYHRFSYVPNAARGGLFKLKPNIPNTDSLAFVLISADKLKNPSSFEVKEVISNGAEVELRLDYSSAKPIVILAVINLKTSMASNNSTYSYSFTPDEETSVEDDKMLSDISIYPMPAESESVLELNNSFSGMASYTISDLSGKTLMNNSFYTETGKQLLPLNISGLQSGSYFITVENGNSRKTIKFVVK